MKKILITAIMLTLLMASWAVAGTRVETDNFVFSNALVRIVGTNTATTLDGYGGNGLEIDGAANVDKNLLFKDAGKNTFTWMIYRGEAGKYFYLHDYEASKQIFSISRSGRIGVNKMSNLLNYHTLTDQAEKSSDLEIDTTLTVYSPNYQLVYKIEITATNPASADTYSVSYAGDSTSTAYTTNLTGLKCSATSTNFGNGIWAYWTQNTGHLVGEQRKFLGIPQLPRASMSINPQFIDEVIINTNFYGAPYWIDKTYDANSSQYGIFRPLRVGTNSAMYIGMAIPNNSFYANIVTGAVGAVIRGQYWAGGEWKAASNAVDNTANLSVSGDISFDTTKMSDWTKTNLTVEAYTNSLYWYRIYSISNVTTEPYFQSITRHGTTRFQVYQAPLDDIPIMKVDADGYTWLGGLPLTPATVQTFYYKFLAQCPTQAVAGAASARIGFSTEVSDRYNVYTNNIWSPNSTSMCRMNWSIRTSDVLVSARGYYVVLFQNGVAIRDIDIVVSGANTDVPISDGTYIFVPPSATNTYSIGARRFSTNDVTLAGGNTNWWFGEKIQ